MRHVPTRSRYARALRVVVALGIAVALSGCVVYPAYGPYHYPHRAYWY